MAELEGVTMSAMRTLAMMVANFWSQYIKPVKFDQVFYLPGIRVRMIIEEYKTEQDTKPIPDERLQFGKSE